MNLNTRYFLSHPHSTGNRVKYSKQFISKGLLHFSRLTVMYAFQLIWKVLVITPQIFTACHILNSEFLDANTQAILARMDIMYLYQGKNIHLETCSLLLIGNHGAISLVDKIKMHCYLCGTIQVLQAFLQHPRMHWPWPTKVIFGLSSFELN